MQYPPDIRDQSVHSYWPLASEKSVNDVEPLPAGFHSSLGNLSRTRGSFFRRVPHIAGRLKLGATAHIDIHTLSDRHTPMSDPEIDRANVGPIRESIVLR